MVYHPANGGDDFELLFLQNNENEPANCTYEFAITPRGGATQYVNHTKVLGPRERSEQIMQTYPRSASVGTNLYGKMAIWDCVP